MIKELSRPYPIVEYARKIGKNTADLTTMDLVRFTREWMKQPPRKDIIAMGKKYTTQSFQKMQTSRLAEQGIESPINDGEEEIVIHDSDAGINEDVVDEIVCSMELTRADASALLFSIERTFADYEMEKGQPFTISLTKLKEGLEGV